MKLYKVIWNTNVNGRNYQHSSGLIIKEKANAQAAALAEAVEPFAAKDIRVIPVCEVE